MPSIWQSDVIKSCALSTSWCRNCNIGLWRHRHDNSSAVAFSHSVWRHESVPGFVLALKSRHPLICCSFEFSMFRWGVSCLFWLGESLAQVNKHRETADVTPGPWRSVPRLRQTTWVVSSRPAQNCKDLNDVTFMFTELAFSSTWVVSRLGWFLPGIMIICLWCVAVLRGPFQCFWHHLWRQRSVLHDKSHVVLDLVWILAPIFVCSNLKAVSSNHPAWQPTGWLKRWAKCAWLLTLLKSLSPHMLGGKWSEPIENFIMVSARAKLDCRENGISQNPILSAKNVPTCAWVRLSFPYYQY